MKQIKNDSKIASFDGIIRDSGSTQNPSGPEPGPEPEPFFLGVGWCEGGFVSLGKPWSWDHATYLNKFGGGRSGCW